MLFFLPIEIQFFAKRRQPVSFCFRRRATGAQKKSRRSGIFQGGGWCVFGLAHVDFATVGNVDAALQAAEIVGLAAHANAAESVDVK